MAKKSGLGRGLNSLFQDTGSIGDAKKNTDVNVLSITDIEPDKEQPRKEFDEEMLSELSNSIKTHGVLQPIVVRPTLQGGYKIVAGERRWRAARKAGLVQVPVVIKEIDDETAMEIALIENLQREDLNPVEEALGYKHLMERCNYTQEMAAKQVAKSRSAVANSLRILNLPGKTIDYIKNGKLSFGHAKVILSIEDKKVQQQAADEIVEKELNVKMAAALCKQLSDKPKVKKKVDAFELPSLPKEVELSLREVLGTGVKVSYKNGNGSIAIDFYSDEQLKAFANLLGKYKV